MEVMMRARRGIVIRPGAARGADFNVSVRREKFSLRLYDGVESMSGLHGCGT